MLPGTWPPRSSRSSSASAPPPACAASRSPTATRSRIFTKDGRERWFDITSALHRRWTTASRPRSPPPSTSPHPQARRGAAARHRRGDLLDHRHRLPPLARPPSRRRPRHGVRLRLRGRRRAATRVRLLALWEIDDYGPPFEYDLRGTPCEQVVGREICFHPAGSGGSSPRTAGCARPASRATSPCRCSTAPTGRWGTSR